jgi:UDP-glucose 4-epimerase
MGTGIAIFWQEDDSRAKIGVATRPRPQPGELAYSSNVHKHVPDVSKAERVLGYRATTSLSEMLDGVILWIKQQIEYGNI